MDSIATVQEEFREMAENKELGKGIQVPIVVLHKQKKSLPVEYEKKLKEYCAALVQDALNEQSLSNPINPSRTTFN